MGRPPLSIDVAPKDRKDLAELLSGGVQQVRVVLRALALRQLARGASAPQIAKVVPLTPQAIRNIGHRYQEGGLERALYERQRPGAAEVLNDSQKQRLIAMVCSNPPEGRARWLTTLYPKGLPGATCNCSSPIQKVITPRTSGTAPSSCCSLFTGCGSEKSAA